MMWLSALAIGIIVGKLVIHHLLLKRLLKLSMFSNDQGSWMICFLFTILCLVIFSFVYNGFLSLDDAMEAYKITGYIGAKNHVFMRAAAIGTWFGDFLTSWMITDMMLQVKTILIYIKVFLFHNTCLLYTSPSPRDKRQSRMPSSA